ncbi:transcription initiation factor TFIID subunit 4B-like [Anneissia japonica]|uniref:transcription initiation factor TFIID subunit 4B-like n=1 Tax=Anneissia japonica TaxID=1529436 RepID=UPI001425A2EC|nr:transcription initiation factor TFIID subunit 4B-like [Anneissia japonica]
MAGTTSLEDILSSEVDESAVRSLVGSLESQLASSSTLPTNTVVTDTPGRSNHAIITPNSSSNNVQPVQPATTAIQNSLSSGAKEVESGAVFTTNKTIVSVAPIQVSNTQVSTSGVIVSSDNKTLPKSGPPTTCVRIITLPTTAGGTVLATENSSSATVNLANSAKNIMRANNNRTTQAITQQIINSQAVSGNGKNVPVSSSTTVVSLESKPTLTLTSGKPPPVKLTVREQLNIQQGTEASQFVSNMQPQVVQSIRPRAAVNPSVVTIGISNTSSTATRAVTPNSPQVVVTNQVQSGGQILTQPVRIATGQQVIAPRPQNVHIRLSDGTTLPPGVVLIKDGMVVGGAASLAQHVTNSQGTVYRTVQSPQVLTQSAIRAGNTVRLTSPSTQVQLRHPLIQGSANSIATRPAMTVLTAPGKVNPALIGGSTATTLTSGVVGVNTIIGQPSAASGVVTLTSANMDSVKKCKNFLTTLIKLAANAKQPPNTVQNVKDLVQNLVDGKIEPEEFTLKLQKELNSSPQPYLVPFLKKSLPLLRQTLKGPLLAPQLPVTPVMPPGISGSQPNLITSLATTDAKTSGPASSTNPPKTINLNLNHVQLLSQGAAKGQFITPPPRIQSPVPSRVSVPGQSLIQPNTLVNHIRPATINPGTMILNQAAKMQAMHRLTAAAAKASPAATPPRDKGTKHSFRDDDDINDVASMAGVNLMEENARILATNSELIGTQIRSCKDETFLGAKPLHTKISTMCAKHGLGEVTAEVVNLISHATQQRLKDLVEKLDVASLHRTEIYKTDSRYEEASDVRRQLKFFEQLDTLEKKRRDEQERELLLRAAKSRSKQEDPEQLRLKQKAKEMQQKEMDQARMYNANMVALDAIGPRKKRKRESPTPGSISSGGIGSAVLTGSSPSVARTQIRRVKRVNLRDLLFVLEQERETRKSDILYRGYLK